MNEDIEIFDLGPLGPGRSTPPTATERREAGGVPLPAGGVPPATRGVPLPTAVLALVAAVVLSAGAALAVAHQRRTVDTRRTVTATAPQSVDVLGCPLHTQCTVKATPAPAIAGALGNLGPGTMVQAGTTVATVSGQPLLDDVVAVIPVQPATGSRLVVVDVVSQCVPSGSSRTGSDVTSPDGRTKRVVVPGRRGCSVAVTATAVGGPKLTAGVRAALVNLAHTGDLQL